MNFVRLCPEWKARIRVSLLLALAPFFLSACLFEEISQEKTELVFESSGAVRYSLQAEGTLKRSAQNMSETERAQALAEFEERVSEAATESFGDGYIGSSVTPRSAMEATARLDGRFLPAIQKVDEKLPPLRIKRFGSHTWEVKVLVRNVGNHPTTLCITLEPGWAVLQQPAALPVMTLGRENCIDLREIKNTGRNNSWQIIRVDTDGRPADGRPDAAMAEADIYTWFEQNVPFWRIRHIDMPFEDRPNLPADTEKFTFTALVNANEQLYAFVEEIDEVIILRKSAQPSQTMTVRGYFEWQIDDQEWKIRDVRFDNFEETKDFGYSRAYFENDGRRIVIDGTLEAEMLRVKQAVD